MRCPSCRNDVDVTVELPGSEGACRCGAMIKLPDARPGGRARAAKRAASGPACPRCKTRLLTVDEIDGQLQECPTCGGVFLDEGTARDVTRGAARALASRGAARGRAARKAPLAEEGYLRCPACRELMRRVNFGHRSGIILDVCSDHGTWFDSDELARAITFVEEGGLRPPTEKSKASAERARKEKDLEQHVAFMKTAAVAENYRTARRVGQAATVLHWALRALFRM